MCNKLTNTVQKQNKRLAPRLHVNMATYQGSSLMLSNHKAGLQPAQQCSWGLLGTPG